MRSWNAQKITSDEAQDIPAQQHGRASWYAQGVSDALGDRLLMFDNSRGPSLELLRFSWRIAASAEFEKALRERVDVLSQFRHDAFTKIRAVEKLEPQKDLTLVSNYVSGKRLSEGLGALRGPVFASWVIRELISGLAELQQHARGVSHGAFTADRIVLTPEGHLVIVEPVLGSALERLHLAPNDLWLRFGIPTPPTGHNVAVLDPATDVFQLGLVALAVLIGRPLASYEYPSRLAETLDAYERSSGRELPRSLRTWLTRALHLSGQPFESAKDAQNGLGELQAAPNSAELLGAGMLAAGARTIERGRWALEAADKDADPSPRARTVTEAVAAPARSAVIDTPKTKEREVSRRLIEEYTNGGGGIGPFLVAALVALVVAQSAYIVYLLYFKEPQIVVQAPQTAAADVAAALAPESLKLQQLTEPRAERAAAPAVRPVPAPALPRSGGVRVVSPLELQVLEGDRVLGSSNDGPIVASAGRHELDFVNNALGYRDRRVVTLKPGEVMALSIPHPEGRISVNAVPWADVWIDSVHVGETPLANLSVLIGQHEVSFRHPSYGEQKRTTIVRHDTPTRISADLR